MNVCVYKLAMRTQVTQHSSVIDKHAIQSPTFSSTRLPLIDFTHYWTPSSKFFSTFPHGTCLLSVSCSI